MRSSFFALLFLAGCCLSTSAQAQTFSDLELSVSPSLNVNRNYLHQFWRVEPGAALRVATPFHGGYLESGLRWERFKPWYGDLPGFDATLIYAGWGIRSLPANWLSLSLGIRVGNLRMGFNKAAASGVRTENELTLGANARVDVWLGRSIGLFIEGSYGKTFTFVRMNLYHSAAGLAVRFSTPSWIRRLLD